MNIRNIIIVSLFLPFAFISTDCLASISTLNRMNILPLNRATIYFDFLPETYSSRLSDDKRTIYLELPKIEVVDSCRQIVSGGIIKSIQVQTYKDKSLITIMLKERRGYNAVVLPYSKAIMVEVFNWNELSPTDDKYRTGLLAYEDKIYSEASKELINAAKSKHANAFAFAGILLLKSGQVQSSINMLLTSIELDSDIQDKYAALYHAYLINDNPSEAENYLNRFKKLTGVVAPGIWDIDLSVDVDNSLIAMTDSLRNVFASELEIAEAPEPDEESIAQTPNDTTEIVTHQELSLSNYLFEILSFIALAIFISLLYFYLKWRASRQKIISQQKSDVFAETLKTAEVKIKPSRVTDIYKKNELNNTQPEIPNNQKNVDQELIKGVEQILKDAEEKKLHKPIADKEKPTVAFKQSGNPKVELAIHLIEEQRKIKTSALNSIKIDELPNEPDKLNEYAKKLGIEKGGLETKQAIERLISDEEHFKTISKKFRDENNNQS